MITGFIVQATGGDFTPALVLAGVLAFVGSCLYLFIVPSRPVFAAELLGEAAPPMPRPAH